jgi:hypothetical protein
MSLVEGVAYYITKLTSALAEGKTSRLHPHQQSRIHIPLNDLGHRQGSDYEPLLSHSQSHSDSLHRDIRVNRDQTAESSTMAATRYAAEYGEEKDRDLAPAPTRDTVGVDADGGARSDEKALGSMFANAAAATGT